MKASRAVIAERYGDAAAARLKAKQPRRRAKSLGERLAAITRGLDLVKKAKPK